MEALNSLLKRLTQFSQANQGGVVESLFKTLVENGKESLVDELLLEWFKTVHWDSIYGVLSPDEKQKVNLLLMCLGEIMPKLKNLSRHVQRIHYFAVQNGLMETEVKYHKQLIKRIKEMLQM